MGVGAGVPFLAPALLRRIGPTKGVRGEIGHVLSERKGGKEWP